METPQLTTEKYIELTYAQDKKDFTLSDITLR